MDKRTAVLTALFEKKNNRKPKNAKELQDFVQSLGGDKLIKKVDEYIAQAEKEEAAKSEKTKKAAHGAKLDYFRSLKHKCAEDEELVYFKKGGKVGCGCKKKESGGEVTKAQEGAVARFKKRKQDLATKDSIRINSVKGDDELEAIRPGTYKPNPKHNPKDPKSKTHIWVPDRTKVPYNKTSKQEKGGKAEKDCGGAKFKNKFQIGGIITFEEFKKRFLKK